MRSTALACLTLTFLGGCGAGSESILIGLAGPFSQPRGESMQLAAELAVAEINGNGGVGGRQLELVVLDDSAAAEVAVRVARELYDTPRLVAVIGHLNSSATLAAAPVYNGGERPLVAISPSASSPQVTGAGPYTFRVCADDLLHGKRLAEWARNRLGARTAAVLYLNDDYGRGLLTSFSSSFSELGGDVVTADPYIAQLPSFEPYLSRLKMWGGVDALMIAGGRADAERIIITLDSVDLAPAILGADALSGLEASEVDAAGVFISSAYLADRPGSQNRDFVAAYHRAYGDRLPDHRGAAAYDIVYLLGQALNAKGPNRSQIRDYLVGVGSVTPPFEGVTGTIAFDENGDVPDKYVLIGVVRDQRLVAAPEQ